MYFRDYFKFLKKIQLHFPWDFIEFAHYVGVIWNSKSTWDVFSFILIIFYVLENTFHNITISLH